MGIHPPKFLKVPTISVKFKNLFFVTMLQNVKRDTNACLKYYHKDISGTQLAPVGLKSEQEKTAHIQKLAIDKKSTIFVQSI